jgi:hypothetical protein
MIRFAAISWSLESTNLGFFQLLRLFWMNKRQMQLKNPSPLAPNSILVANESKELEVLPENNFWILFFVSVQFFEFFGV